MTEPKGIEGYDYDFKVEVTVSSYGPFVQIRGFFDEAKEQFELTFLGTRHKTLVAKALLFAVNKLRGSKYINGGEPLPPLAYEEVFGREV